MFEAIKRVDRASLRAFAKTFLRTGNDPAALLCMDHVFSSSFKLRNLPLIEVQASLSFYLDYIRLLSKFRNDKSLAQDSSHQRLFGFQVLGDSRYLVPRHTLLYEILANGPGSGRTGVDGYECDHDELSCGVVQLIGSRIHDRTEIQDQACRDVHGFSPCLYLLIEKECNPPKGKGRCPFQHIQPEQLTVDWYHARLHLILLQFQILNTAQYYEADVLKWVLVHSARNACENSLIMKLLAWDIVLGTSPTPSEARIVREPLHHQNTRRSGWFRDRTRIGSVHLLQP